MKKFVKLLILIVLFSLLTISIIIPGNLKANYPPGAYPGILMNGPYGLGCGCPSFPPQCGCYMY